ncbi:MAG: hypothetical protein AB7F96_12720 [Beijerinckiaceae bacterium]
MSLLPPDIGKIDAASMAVLRSMIGANLSVYKIEPQERMSQALWEMRPAARGLLIVLHRFGRAENDGHDDVSIWLRPELLPESDEYAIQRLHASHAEPFSRVPAGRSPGITVELNQKFELKTEFRSSIRVLRIDIFGVPGKVCFDYSDGNIGFHDFDSRIEISGLSGERQHTLSVDVNCTDDLALFPVAYDSSKEIQRPPGVMKPRMTIH